MEMTPISTIEANYAEANKERRCLHKYQKGGHVYILDDNPDEAAAEGAKLLSEHYQKNRMVRQVFKRHTKYKVHGVTFPQGSAPDSVAKYFVAEFKRRSKTELMIIYFHGKGGKNGVEYTWRLDRNPSKEIDAYALIQAIVDAKVDCLILLDAFIPDRFHDTWKASDSVVQIIARGQTLEDSDGTKVENDLGDFTTALVITLEHLVLAIKGPLGVSVGNRRGKKKRRTGLEDYSGYQKPVTLPDLIIRRDNTKTKRYYERENESTGEMEKHHLVKEISSKIRRVQPIGTKGHFVIDPKNVRANGKIEFFHCDKRENKCRKCEEVDPPSLETDSSASESDENTEKIDDEGVDVSKDLDQAAQPSFSPVLAKSLL